MRNRGDVPDNRNGHTRSLKRAHSGFASGAGALDKDLDLSHAVFLGLIGRVFGYDLRGISRAFSGSGKTHLTGVGPGDNIALDVRYADNSVVEGRSNVNYPGMDILGNLLPGCLLFALLDFGIALTTLYLPLFISNVQSVS